jgi:hypothetical protein
VNDEPVAILGVFHDVKVKLEMEVSRLVGALPPPLVVLSTNESLPLDRFACGGISLRKPRSRQGTRDTQGA